MNNKIMMNMSLIHSYKGINDLNEYFEILDTENHDIILLIAVCDEGSRYFENINFRSYKENMIDNLGFREGFAAIFDKALKRNIHDLNKKAEVNYNWKGHEFSSYSGGFVDGSNTGHAYFIIDGERYELYCNRGFNFLLFSKSEERIIDIFCVDTYADPTLKINRYSEEGIANMIDSWETYSDMDIPYSVLSSFFKSKTHEMPDRRLDKLICLLRSGGVSARTALVTLLHIRDTESDHKEAVDILTQLAEEGDGDAMGHLARAYRHGRGVPQDLDKAADWINKAKDENAGWGDELVSIRLDQFRYYKARMKNGDYQRPYSIMIKNLSDPLWELSKTYIHGIGVDRDLIKGCELLKMYLAINPDHCEIAIYSILMKVDSPTIYDICIELSEEYLKESERHKVRGLLHSIGIGCKQDTLYARTEFEKSGTSQCKLMIIDDCIENDRIHEIDPKVIDEIKRAKYGRKRELLIKSKEGEIEDENIISYFDELIERRPWTEPYIESMYEDDVAPLLNLCVLFDEGPMPAEIAKLMKQIPFISEGLKTIQVMYTDTIDYIQKMCNELHIDVILYAGTLLGCARHSGPIPWDDDADVMMFESDISILRQYLIEVGSRYRIEEFPHYGKFYKIRSLDFFTSLDIFPLETIICIDGE